MMMGAGEGPSEVVQSIWMTENKIRSDDENQSSILRLDKNIIIFLDHKKKTYTEVPMDIAKAVGDDMSSEDLAQLQKMMKGMMKLSISVTATGEKKKIKNWNCRKYIQTITAAMGPVTSEIWATEDIKIDYDLYARFSAALMAQQPGLREVMDDIIKEMKKIRGVGVLSTTTMNMMGKSMKSSTELLEAKEGKAPAGIFEIPSEYKKAKP
jgi:hypothetical protein